MKPTRRPLIRLERHLHSTIIERADTGEYLKQVDGWDHLPPGRYRITLAPKTGRFQFCLFTHDFFGPLYSLFDYARDEQVTRPHGGGWCGWEVRAFGLARNRFNVHRVKGAR